jgi:A/G-specific adenine glycosylase
VYTRFIERFPDIASLDQAPAEEVLEILRSLGLGWRAANFKHLAHAIMTRHAGEVPRDREALLALPGVGPYVADAVRCFAFHEPSTLVDTNTVRVAARYFGFDYDPESRRRPAVIQAVSALIEPDRAARSNYAMLDFAATICRARDPDHARCPLAERCVFYNRLRINTASHDPRPEADTDDPASARKNQANTEEASS